MEGFLINQLKLCYEILYGYEKDKLFLNLLIKDRLKDVKSEHKGMITEIVCGVVRNKLFLDTKISEYSKIKLKKLSLNVLIILRIAFYEIYFMDSVPDYAIINENVNLAKKYAYKSAGFINGILRNGIKKTDSVYPDNIKYSFPDFIYSKIKEQYGGESIKIFEELNHKKPSAIRPNRLKITDTELKNLLKDNCYEENSRLFMRGNIKNEYFEKGLFSVSGIASQAAVEVLDPQKDETILDCCSAPGGKTAYIAELMGNTGHITALELHKHRCVLVMENLKRLGITNAEVISADASAKIDGFCKKFDRVICDVPCSGWGVIGNKPDIKWQDINIEELKILQKNILHTVADYVKIGGILVYSTCTINREENAETVKWFLKNNGSFEKVPFEVTLDGVTYGKNGEAEIMPYKNTSGFYICKMRKL